MINLPLLKSERSKDRGSAKGSLESAMDDDPVEVEDMFRVELTSSALLFDPTRSMAGVAAALASRLGGEAGVLASELDIILRPVLSQSSSVFPHPRMWIQSTANYSKAIVLDFEAETRISSKT